jgi:hypothetical protein
VIEVSHAAKHRGKHGLIADPRCVQSPPLSVAPLFVHNVGGTTDRCCRRLRAVQGHLVVLGSGLDRPLGDVSTVSSRIGRQSHKSPLTAGPGPALGISPVGYLVVLQQFWSYHDGLGECQCYLFSATAT